MSCNYPDDIGQYKHDPQSPTYEGERKKVNDEPVESFEPDERIQKIWERRGYNDR